MPGFPGVIEFILTILWSRNDRFQGVVWITLMMSHHSFIPNDSFHLNNKNVNIIWTINDF